ncbi:hypothetical protein LJC05_01795 [Bacteroides sp. OttesenSCG-928-J23]|nr:hypothetical protein [Bacteroides sp. OttesenSCG-928-J23]
MKRFQAVLIATWAIILTTSCTSEVPDPGFHTDEATVSITANTAGFLPLTRGGAPLGAEGFTRAGSNIKTNFLPGDVIKLSGTGITDGSTLDATYTANGTWQTTLALPIDAAVSLKAEYLTGTDPLTATATTTDGTITLGADPATGKPVWNITFNFTHTSAVVDVILLADDGTTNITSLMQSVTINANPASTTATDILLPAGDPGITSVSVVAAGITYTVDNLNATLAANTRYTLVFVCNPTTPTVTIDTTNGTDWKEGGTGTVPIGYDYYINSYARFETWYNDPAKLNKKAIQLTDIVWNADWIPVGSGDGPFTGVYNGNGHTITGLNIDRVGNTGDYYSGMFGRVDTDAVLTGIHLRGATIGTTTTPNTAIRAGLLVGGAYNATISLCSAQGSITNTGGEYVGGLVGYASGTHITRCYADATIEHAAPGYNSTYTGGLVGENNNSPIIACGAHTNITVTDATTDIYAGGLVGENDRGIIYFSYANATISLGESISARYAGGLVGENVSTIAHCYAIASATGGVTGKLVGRNDHKATITQCHAAGTPVGYNSNPDGTTFVDNRKEIRAGNTPDNKLIRTIHLDPDGYHDALNLRKGVTFYGERVWTDEETPLINYNYEGE